MNSQQRFQLTMSLEKPDRVPLFQEGIREDVINTWSEQGLSRNESLDDLFAYDERQEKHIELELGWELEKLSGQDFEQPAFKEQYYVSADERIPEELRKTNTFSSHPEATWMLRVNHGFFLSLEIGDWSTFYPAVLLACDNPEFIKKHLGYIGELSTSLLKKAAGKQTFDAVVFSEPISSSHGPLISPQMYRDMVLPGYLPAIRTARELNIETIIIRTYANFRRLLPHAVEAGFNCLWAIECGSEDMDYLDIRREYGNSLRLIGGINREILSQEEKTIRSEVERVVPELLAQGGYIPLINGRVREEIPFSSYRCYRHILEETVNSIA